MSDYKYLWPQSISVLDMIFLILFIVAIIIAVFFALRIYKRSSDKEKQFTFLAYAKRFNLNEYQTALLKKVLSLIPFLNINSLFSNEVYFDESARQYINYNKKEPADKLKNDFNFIKQRINFKENIPFTSKDVPINQNVKLRIDKIGFITANVLNADEDGILLSTYFKDAVNRVNPKENLDFYYWDNFTQYEAHTKVKKISKINFIQYILLEHCRIVLKNKAAHGFKINVGLPIFFTHIFKLPKELKIESHFFKGEINTFSMIGAEIFTNFKIVPTGIFLFEFHPLGDNKKRFHFTGKAVEYKKVRNGTLIFIKYIDMNEECKNYIMDIISEKLNEMK